MSDLFGTLCVFMFVVMPTGRHKRVSLASIPCEYVERDEVFRKFVDNNGSRLLKADLCAEFVLREPVDL